MKTNLVLGVVAAAGVLMSAGGALAQGARDDGYTVNLKKRDGGASAGGSVTMLMSQSEGDDTYTVRIENGQVTAEVNGKEVPKDRVIREDGHIRILDKNGETLAEFNDVQAAGGAWWNGTGNLRGLRFSPGAGTVWVGPEGQAQAKAWAPPKVMIGINMAEPSEALTEHLDLKPGTAILVDKVHEGLPADKAGLRQGDVIIEIDGNGPATQERLREILSTKDSGDTLELRVLRKGEKETIKVQLAPFDAEKLGVAKQAEGDWNAWVGGDNEGADHARKMIEEYTRQFGDEELQKKMHEAFKQYEKALRDGGRGFMFATPEQDGQFRFMAPHPGGEVDQRMEELDRRLDELNHRLDEIHSKIDSLMEKFDQLRERR